jgi:gas vesicle protein
MMTRGEGGTDDMDNNRHNHQHHQGGLNGFIFGVLIGVAITLLFTTKKGRRLLKALTDEGLDKVSKWEDLLDKKIEQKIESINDDLEEREFVEVVEEPVRSVTATPPVASKNGASHHTKKEEKEPELRHTVRRFFRTAKKK